jgi:hypothetical protein
MRGKPWDQVFGSVKDGYMHFTGSIQYFRHHAQSEKSPNEGSAEMLRCRNDVDLRR